MDRKTFNAQNAMITVTHPEIGIQSLNLLAIKLVVVAEVRSIQYFLKKNLKY